MSLSGCAKKTRFTVADVAEQVFGDSEHMAAMASATSVTAYRLHSKSNDDGSSDESFLAGYTQSEPVQLSDPQVLFVKQLFRQPTSYDLEAISLCIPNYGILLVFHSQPHDIRVALCLQCDQLAVFAGDRRLNKADLFDPMRPKVVSLAKALFPKDSEIESLP